MYDFAVKCVTKTNINIDVNDSYHLMELIQYYSQIMRISFHQD